MDTNRDRERKMEVEKSAKWRVTRVGSEGEKGTDRGSNTEMETETDWKSARKSETARKRKRRQRR